MSAAPAPDKRWFEKYDDEFRYADEIEPRVGEIMQRVENGPRHTQTSSQNQEEFLRLFEANADARKEYRWTHQEEFKTRREGRILHMNKFMGMLRDCGVSAWYTEKGGMPKTLGLYVHHGGMKSGCFGKHERDEPHYVCFVQVPLMQEYEEVFFDRYDVPLGVKRRGWRTVLLRLIEAGLLSEKKAHEIFGEPASGPVSRRYQQYLHFLRNKPN